MKVDVRTLKKALEVVRPGVAKKVVVEQMSHFIFTEEEVTAYDDQICISYPVETGLKCTVKADTLYKFISKVDVETLRIDLEKGEDKAILICKGQGIETEIPVLLDQEIYEHVVEVQKQRKSVKWEVIPEQLISAMGFCMFAASTDETKGSAVCVVVSGKDVIANDGHRCGWCELKEPSPTDFMINARSVSELVKFGGFDKICVSDSWVHFKTKDKATFHIRRNVGDYPMDTCKKVFGFEGVELKLSAKDGETIKEAVETASIFSEEVVIDKTVEITIENGRVICKGGVAEIGKITRRKTLELEHPGEVLTFLINPHFLLQSLNKDNPAKIMIGEKLIELRSDNFRHAIALRG
jgi:hypothetical protein